jgi:hypothetical protein
VAIDGGAHGSDSALSFLFVDTGRDTSITFGETMATPPERHIRLFIERRRPDGAPQRYVEITWEAREVEVAKGRLGSAKARVQTLSFESTAQASAFIEEQISELKGYTEADPAAISTGPSPEEEPAMPEALHQLGVPLERAPLPLPTFVSAPLSNGRALCDQIHSTPSLAGYSTVLVGPFAWELVEEAMQDPPAMLTRARRALARARKLSGTKRLAACIAAREKRAGASLRGILEAIGGWTDASVVAPPTEDLERLLLQRQGVFGPTPLDQAPGARLVVLRGTPAEIPIALQCNGGNDCPSWEEVADLLAGWEHFAPRLRFTDGNVFTVGVEHPPRELEEARQVALAHAAICTSLYDFRFDGGLLETRGAPWCLLRAATLSTWFFFYE